MSNSVATRRPLRNPDAPKRAHRSVGLHAAILLPQYLDLILAGRKTVESRLSLHRRDPFGVVAPGDRIYFKDRGGSYRACAVVSAVESFDALTPRTIRLLRQQYEPLVLAGHAYWRERTHAHFATMMHLRMVKPVTTGPQWTPHGRGWLTIRTRS